MRLRTPARRLTAFPVALLLLLLTLPALPVAAQTPCDSHAGRVADIDSREQIRALVDCAAEHIETVGWEQATLDFETAAWMDGSVYLFAGDTSAVIHFIAGSGLPAGTDMWPMQDAEGHFFAQDLVRIAQDFGAGYSYYRMTNRESGEEEPKIAYARLIERDGEPAVIGAGYHPRDSHGSCPPDRVRAALVYDERDLEAYVNCAAHHLQQVGLRALHDFQHDPRWHAGAIYLFLYDLESAFAVFSAGQPQLVGQIRDASAYAEGRVPVVPEIQRILANRDDGHVYYTFRNPVTDAEGRKIAYARRVLFNGREYLLASGIYVPAEECRHLPPARAIDTRDGLQQYVRCAAQLVEERGELAFELFLNHPQWLGGTLYLFLLDENCDYLATPYPQEGVNNGLCDFEDAQGTPVDQEIRARVTSAEGEGWVNYVWSNPLSGEIEGKESYVVGVTLNGELISVGAGLYESQLQS